MKDPGQGIRSFYSDRPQLGMCSKVVDRDLNGGKGLGTIGQVRVVGVVGAQLGDADGTVCRELETLEVGSLGVIKSATSRSGHVKGYQIAATIHICCRRTT